MSARPTIPPESDSLLARMGKERFLLAFVADHLRGLPLSARNGARELSLALERIQTASREVSTSISEGFGRLRQFVETAEGLGGQADTTFKHLEEIAEAMRKALADTGDLVRVVGRHQEPVEQRSSQIEALESTARGVRGEVARLADLAEQINLLALNAVIEADHTGREGRPFGMLAGEIRTIASRMAEEARQVQVAVERIESEVLEATGRVGNNQRRYREGAAKAGELSTDLTTLERGLDTLRSGQEEFRRQYRAVLDHVQEIRTRYEQLTALTERVLLTQEGVASAMREQQCSLGGLAQNLEEMLLTVETSRAGREAEDAVGLVRSNLGLTGQSVAQSLASERELSSGLDNASRLGSDQSSLASLAQRKGERLEVVASALVDRAAYIRDRGRDLLSAWETRTLSQVLALIGHIEQTVTDTHEAVEAVGALEGRILTIDITSASIARLALKIDMVALTGSLEAMKAGLDGSGFGNVAQQVRQLAGEANRVADRIGQSVFHLQSALGSIRRNLDEAEGAARGEQARSTRVRENLLQLKDILRGLEANLDSIHQSTGSTAAESASLLKDAGLLVHAADAATASLQLAARAQGSASSSLAAISRGMEKVAARMEA